MSTNMTNDRRLVTAELLCAYATYVERLPAKHLCLRIRPQLDTYKPLHGSGGSDDDYYSHRKGLMGQLQRWWGLPMELRDPLACDWIADVNSTQVRIKEFHDTIRGSLQSDAGRPLWNRYLMEKPSAWRYSGPTFGGANVPKPEDFVRHIDPGWQGELEHR